MSIKKIFILSLVLLSACNLQDKSFYEFFNTTTNNVETPTSNEVAVQNTPLKMADSIVVCRAKQCAPAKASMSREYIYNSLLQLFENNNKQTALVCQASRNSHTCLENYITIPITVGITPAYLYVDSVKISDITVGTAKDRLNLLLNYNVTFNGQTPECTTAETIVFAKSVDHVILEDAGYYCKMTSIGKTTIKTVFIIDYIDLDYGFIGGYYSLGLSGPAFGGGTGYMMLRLTKDAYPLSPILMDVKKTKAANSLVGDKVTLKAAPLKNAQKQKNETIAIEEEFISNVEVFPITK